MESVRKMDDLRKLSVSVLQAELESRQLSIVGKKEELVKALWSVLEPELTTEEAASTQVIGTGNPNAIVTDGTLELQQIRRELDLIRRENEILMAERRSTSRELTTRNKPYDVRVLADLIPEFEVATCGFESWESQLNVVKDTFLVEDQTMKMLLVGKLKGAALRWFHSKPEHVRMSFAELLVGMKAMFGTRVNRLTLRKQFEARLWRPTESFTTYFHDKVILANGLSIPEDELIDYIIDGFNNPILQSQVRIQCFTSLGEIMDACSRMTTNDRGGRLPRETGPPRMGPQTGKSGKGVPKEVKCFNCNVLGHYATDCTKQKRERGTCFTCGKSGHRYADCPEKPGKQTDLKIEKKTILNVESEDNIDEFKDDITVELCSDNMKATVNFRPIMDSGSPISFIKQKYIADQFILPYVNDCSFAGINDSQLKIVGIFYSDVFFQNEKKNMKIYVVSNDSMKPTAIVGRDFLRMFGLRFAKGNDTKLNKEVGVGQYQKEEIVDVAQQSESRDNLKGDAGEDVLFNIMNIDYCTNSADSWVDELNLNEKINVSTKNKFIDVFKENYKDADRPSCPETEFEMKIRLNKDEVFSFRPRRLSFIEGAEVKDMIGDLLKKSIIRPSTTPYSSPIVLVKKKNKEKKLGCALTIVP